MAFYILQTIIFQAVFLIIYDLFHKKDTFFGINRFYLLASSALSLVVPFVKIDSIRQGIPDHYITDLPAVFIEKSSSNIPISERLYESSYWSLVTLDINLILVSLYTLVVSILLFLFVKKIFAIYRLKYRTPVLIESSLKIHKIPNSRDAFSFLNMIFIGDQFSARERTQILAHETVHLKEKHTVDLLWFEFLKIVFWFNPLMYLYHSRILIVHEYISDASAVHTLGKSAYFEQLLNCNFQTENIRFTNHFFNTHLLKKRILMLQKSRSKKSTKLKYLIILPVLISMVICNSFLLGQEDISQEPPTGSEAKSKTHTADTDIPFKKVDKLPSTKTCQGISDRTEQEKCVSNEIREYVNSNFDVEAVLPYSNQGINRIYVRFKIDTEGKIVQVQSRGPAPELEKEALRVVSALPPMMPGEHKGQKVNVLYSLPIIFEKEKDTPETLSHTNDQEIAILTEILNDNTIEKGYYLITNIFKSERYLEKGIQQLKAKNLDPKVFQNPKDNYYYVYLKKFDTAAQAKKNLGSNYEGKYQGDMYILRIQ